MASSASNQSNVDECKAISELPGGVSFSIKTLLVRIDDECSMNAPLVVAHHKRKRKPEGSTQRPSLIT
ncbi:hypothetical protein OUZ56_019113 [Daphnia magna]|uniref:Uncharacterized protein n=1 Tax=Daphnia magna TaxID=35525 RepID=A0ABQ9ZAU5_9CRUS|nr:hypothetical protein OUZ56_019113 [Daphnia magna]